MKILLTARNRIEAFYARFSIVIECVLRFILSFFILLAVRNNLGYNALLSQMWFVIAFSIVCAFIKIRGLVIILGAYSAMQVVNLSLGIGLTIFMIMLILYLIYFRIKAQLGYALLLMLLFYIIKIPLAIPFVLAAVYPFSAVTVVISANIIYYMLHYVNMNSAMLAGYTENGEITVSSVFLNGLLTYKEFIYTLLIMVLVFLIIYFVKKINMNHANDMAIAVGAGMYIILALITNIFLSTLTFQKLRVIILGTLGAFVLALIVENLILPLDFSKAEMLEFEDSEYRYYVRAVPKVALDKESVHITRINSRKTIMRDTDRNEYTEDGSSGENMNERKEDKL